MTERVSTLWFASYKKFIKAINPDIRFYIINKYLWFTEIAFLLIFLMVIFFNPQIIQLETLHWLLSAISQSMAALFAVVGMFAVFRYQDIQRSLEGLYSAMKSFIESEEHRTHFRGYTDTSWWTDDEVLDRAQEIFNESKDKLYKILETSFNVRLTVIKSHEEVREHIKHRAKIPMISILITFIFSILSLIFSAAFFTKFSIFDFVTYKLNLYGILILIIIFVFVIFSMISIFKYFLISIPSRRRDISKNKEE